MFCCNNSLRYYRNKKIKLIFVIVIFFISTRCYAESVQKRYIFIDGGAHYGESILAFKTTNLYKNYLWEIFAIEANPNLIKKLKEIPSITIINKAMWKEEGTIEFNLSGGKARGSSIYESDDHDDKMIVETFDFGQWLKRNFSVNDFIIVSLDIEAAEYEILDKMFLDGTIKYVDRFYIEFHGKYYNQFLDKEKELIEKMNDLGILKGLESVDHVTDSSVGGWVEGWIDTIEE